MQKKSIAVIGGGLAGLTAAAELAERGIAVTIFEASAQLGGRARTVAIHHQHQTHLLDNGQHILLGVYEKTLSLLAKVGVNPKAAFMRLPLTINMHSCIAQQQIPTDTANNKSSRAAFSLRSARSLPAPMHLLVGIICCQGLSLKDRFAAIQFMQQLKATQFSIQNDCTLVSLLEQYHQPEKLIKMLWEPLCLAALNTPIKNASARIFLNVLRDSFTGKKTDSDFLLPRSDLSKLLSNPMAAFIQKHQGTIHLNARVLSIEAKTFNNTPNFVIHTKTQAQHFSHVILATAPLHTIKLAPSLPALSQVMSQLSAYLYQPIYTVYLQYHTNVKLAQPMIGLVDGISQWVFDRGQLCQQHGLMAVIVSAEGPHQTMSQDELTEHIANELQIAFPQCKNPSWHQVIAEKRATFSCTPDLIRPTHTTAQANMYLAGDYTCADYPATIEGAVRSGVAAAKLI
jgi:squalene-associated FAD-dependent desaturase